jgi:putative transferase (TIGR04331 family)
VTRFLITTALEDAWRDDVPVVFLGEWCRRYSRRSRWSAMDARVVPYHWDDRAKLHRDFRYLSGVYDRLLKDLSAHLNERHGVDRGVRYWRIVVGPWLGYFTQILFDRWTCIHDAMRQCELSETLVLPDNCVDGVPRDMEEFVGLLHRDDWNHRLYAAILTRFTQVPCVTIPRPSPAAGRDVPSPKRTHTARSAVASLYDSMAALLSRDGDAVVRGTSLDARDEMRLQLQLGQMPRRWRALRSAAVPADADHRSWVVAGNGESDFENCLRALIPTQMPTTYLEGRRALLGQIDALPLPRRPGVIWTSHIEHDDVFQAWAADKVDRGTPLVVSQHGGHYGVGRWSFHEDHELAISDRYLSWGWSHPEHPNVAPVGRVSSRRPRAVRHGGQPAALLVTTTVPRYSYWMYSAIVARQWLDYFEDQCAFVESLPAPIRSALIVRLYKADYGWDQRDRWADRFPDIRLDPGTSSIGDLVDQSRLYISTYNATTFLESIAMNVPTVIYWNPRHWELRESAIPYFDDLRRVGIFHSSPQDAAAHVAGIWDDVDGWWSSPEVVDVRARFATRYCHMAPDTIARVAAALRQCTREAALHRVDAAVPERMSK